MKKLLVIYYCVGLGLLTVHCNAQKTPPDTLQHAHRQMSILADSGHQYYNKGDKKKALVFHKKALALARQANSPEHEARSLANIAGILKHENADESLQYLYNALRIARTIRHHTLQADIYNSIAAVYKQQENYKEALNALEQHHRFADTLIQKNRLKEIEQVKNAADRKREQGTAIVIILAILIVTIILAISFRKTRSLNKQLNYAVNVRDKLFSILAHDLRGPANNIVQVLTMMEEDPFSEQEKAEVLTMLKKQGQSLSSTLDSLLHWSKAQLTGVKADPQNVKPYELIHKNVALLAGQARQKSISVRNQTPAEIQVYVDPDHFDLTIRNLLSNAIKFSNTLGEVLINAKQQESYIIFSVTDQGVGITPENQEKFDKHNMEIIYGTSGEKGTGLGLLLVKEVINANKGKIWLESERNKGTTFYFSLPVPDIL